MDHSDLQDRHFTALRNKYQVDRCHSSMALSDFLYLILRKVDLGIKITEFEFQWLKENDLFRTIEIISLEQYQIEDLKRLELEFSNLRANYKIPENLNLSIESPIYAILWKWDTGSFLTDMELDLLNSYQLTETTRLIKDISNFSQLKITYKADQYLEKFPNEPLYSILKKLDVKEDLANYEADWLLDNGFEETLEIYWQQENERKAIAEFSGLKAKYQIDSFPNESIISPLYTVLKKLEEKQDLDQGECKWLTQQKLTQLIEIDQNHKDVKLFKQLKSKYQATQYQVSDPSCQLFLILKKIESEVTEDEIQWLIDKELLETAEIAKVTHFKILKAKYQLVGQLPVDPFYDIMLKIEREERLDPKQVIQLIEEGRLSKRGKIAIAYYRLEAIFYEQEYQRTKNKWNLPSASSNWRKADEPQNALNVTNNINLQKISEPALKSALWVTRGAAFRYLSRLDEAEECAAEAMDSQPESHQPYTLMGAIYYDRREYSQGDKWFEMAAERGANDLDDEIEKIVRMTKDKDKQREVVEYLIKKDSIRYSWANKYLK